MGFRTSPLFWLQTFYFVVKRVHNTPSQSDVYLGQLGNLAKVGGELEALQENPRRSLGLGV